MATINGIVRGIMAGGGDPTRSGRVFVQLPALGNSAGAWAPVCRAFGGSAATGGGGTLGGAVWVAFENGDPNFPVVLGRAD